MEHSQETVILHSEKNSLRPLYSKLSSNNICRPLHIGDQESFEMSPIKLGSSSVDFHNKSNAQVVNNDQRSLLQDQNVLRPKNLVLNQGRFIYNRDNQFAYKSENYENTVSEMKDGYGNQ